MNDANNAARPVAFRVLKHRLSSGYDIYDNEDDAQFSAGERGVSYEGLYLVSDRNTWDCAARKQSLPEPADCDWPTCGCDPYADKVIASLEESGTAPSTPNAPVEVDESAEFEKAWAKRPWTTTRTDKERAFYWWSARAILAGRLDEAAIRKDEREKFGFVQAMDIAERGFETWAAKDHNAKWVRHIDGTPIKNDLLVNIAEAFRSAIRNGGKQP